MPVHSNACRLGVAFLLCSAVLLGSACDAARRSGTGATPATATPIARTAAADTAGPVCAPTGAHGKHASVKIACENCHPCGGVIGFTTTLTYPRGTISSGTYDTTTSPPTCSVGCHSPMGSAPHQVTWTTPAPLACVACHDMSTLPSTHQAATWPHNPPTRDDCLVCHDLSAHTSGTVVVVGHLTGWMDQTSTGFHAFSADAGLGPCKTCHAADLSGGIAGVACGQCHDSDPTRPLPPGVTSWKQNCVMCHGGDQNQTGAPPRTIWGKGTELVRIGAHTAHVQAGPLAGPFGCDVCHVVPADALAPGHIDGPRATVTLGGLAAQGTRPSYAVATATCSSTYCHGATLAGGLNTTPNWTIVDGTQAACGNCHGIPPFVWGHMYPFTHNMNACTFCHYDVADDRGTMITNPSLHVNGVIDVRTRDTDPDCVVCHGE